jgi:hypothetical protein
LGVSVSSCWPKANTSCQQGRGETGAWQASGQERPVLSLVESAASA